MPENLAGLFERKKDVSYEIESEKSKEQGKTLKFHHLSKQC